jgi:NADH dehydrogenase FAD-containing subunit
VPGVQKYCYFMKEVEDTVGLRKRIGECFELASLPGTSVEERKAVLNFVVVGGGGPAGPAAAGPAAAAAWFHFTTDLSTNQEQCACAFACACLHAHVPHPCSQLRPCLRAGGPTGVEFAGTLNDFVRSDLSKKYPQLMPYVRVTLLQSAQQILMQFDAKLAVQAMQNLKESGVEVRTGVRVVEVTSKQVGSGRGLGVEGAALLGREALSCVAHITAAAAAAAAAAALHVTPPHALLPPLHQPLTRISPLHLCHPPHPPPPTHTHITCASLSQASASH